MKKVCLDTNILVWYIKRQATKGQEGFIPKVDYLFKHFEKKNITIVIPSIVLAELLGSVADEDKRDEYFDYLNSNFEIAQYDIVSSRQYADLRAKLSKKNAKQYANKKSVPKCMMINDYNICAVALSSGCDAIFSHNLKDFEKFIDHRIPIYTLDYVDKLKKEEEKITKRQLSQSNQFSLLNDLPDFQEDE
ncbi:type II toxin-antitoxin system VapC family toxin [Zobellia galactanivorans]|uniref:PIN-like protein n=1 Tax=Zobellia galactanivorans (strain DSM 12802 / CCUG 47099 / CIP 106680 / NCIMB 13871 / Dsij) TaxID=63186 RepID=G0L482_ZOBGA|nr:type II toxin-antitoxin system VapC family toxin [Zobellia galactanivorans]CAZ98718.1 PIN-like protein [Zobellia galactanivorans]